MELKVFQSEKGDCLLLKSDDGRHILVDGGMRAAYRKHVAPALGQMRDDGGILDVVYVSHTDQDHISGVLQLMDDEVAWRVYDYHKGGPGANKHFPEPKAPRPPEVKAVWHNAFHESEAKNNASAIEDMLAATSAVLSGVETGDPKRDGKVKEVAARRGDLATSVAEAIQLSRRVSPDQLGIRLNGPAKGKLMMVRTPKSKPVRVGSLRLHIIAPFEVDLDKYRAKWNEWLRANQDRVKKLQKEAKADAHSFAAAEVADILLPKIAQANELAASLALPAAATKKVLGDRDEVTAPNLASLMFYVEEGKRTLLLTGDGHSSDILKGLGHIGVMKNGGGLHVDVLKVQHHGSENNIDPGFCKLVTADHYVFCGNGEHENPDVDVVRLIAQSRFVPKFMGANPQVGNPFKFWFNSSSAETEKAKNKAHMKKIEKLVASMAQKSNGRLSSFFLRGKPSFTLAL